ncbi:MAG TPA: polysaccharide deacetylase family protein, partial [Candidatus Dormibacteraeota bacterium]|nr:polysaccharide deacetylase family protein [Candidatus Dormibacteraeota bacterium]
MVRALARRVGLRRSTIAALRLRTEREFWSRWPSTPDLGPRILCYHAVGTPSWGYNDISPERFRRHLELALANGHRFVPASQIAQGEGGAQDLAITFDDGLTSVARYAAPIMADMKVPWTMFVVTDWCSGHHDFGSGAILDWTGVQEIVAAGASVG